MTVSNFGILLADLEKLLKVGSTDVSDSLCDLLVMNANEKRRLAAMLTAFERYLQNANSAHSGRARSEASEASDTSESEDLAEAACEWFLNQLYAFAHYSSLAYVYFCLLDHVFAPPCEFNE